LISSLLSRLIPSFTTTPRPTAAMFILHCKFSSSSLFLFFFLRALWPICGTWPHCCRGFQIIEFLRS
jgi:hypothetical protein